MDTIECDMAITKDDVVVIHHDLRLNPDITRGPDGQWLDKPGPTIRDLTFDELQKYDVGRIKPGTKYAQDFPDQQPADGTRIPRLSDLFDLVKKSGNAKVGFDCETKLSPLEPDATLPPEAFAKRVVAEIRKHGMAEAHDDPVLRLAHAAGGAEGGARDPHDVPLVAAHAQAGGRRQALALARRLRPRAARLRAEGGEGGRREDLGAQPDLPHAGAPRRGPLAGHHGHPVDGERPRR